MSFGYNAWDASGVPNNYGIKPVSVTGFTLLDVNQKSGQWSYAVPAGYNMTFFFVGNGDQPGTSRRRITQSGNSISISDADDTDYSDGTYPATRGFIIVQVVR
ncbi:TPA: hypothetical protein NPP51_003299 [Klebsiella quasipneumoniae subsp. quasipneumoniae]|nr:hypothetical protein [Klebsiella quasipneumoniae subsp. quasipneumoniae]